MLEVAGLNPTPVIIVLSDRKSVKIAGLRLSYSTVVIGDGFVKKW